MILSIIVLLAGIGGTFLIKVFFEFLHKLDIEAKEKNKHIEYGTLIVSFLAFIISIISIILSVVNINL